MSRLEEFINDNKQAFEENPPKGHWKRLQKYREERQQRKSRTFPLQAAMGIAASIAATVAIIVFHPAITKNNLELTCEQAADMKYCYLGKMDIVAGQIEELVKDYDSWDKQEVMDNVQEIISATQGTDLEDELPPELSAAEHQAILSDYYQHNLSSIEGIVYSLLN